MFEAPPTAASRTVDRPSAGETPGPQEGRFPSSRGWAAGGAGTAGDEVGALADRLSQVAACLEAGGHRAVADHAALSWSGSGRAEADRRLQELDTDLRALVAELRERAAAVRRLSGSAPQ